MKRDIWLFVISIVWFSAVAVAAGAAVFEVMRSVSAAWMAHL